MKYIIALMLVGCTPPSTHVDHITPTSRMELTTFYILTEDSSEYFAHIINFIDTGDMWVMWTKYSLEPEFVPIFRIDHHGNIRTNPYSKVSSALKMSIIDMVAHYFKMAHEFQRGIGKIRVIKQVRR